MQAKTLDLEFTKGLDVSSYMETDAYDNTHEASTPNGLCMICIILIQIDDKIEMLQHKHRGNNSDSSEEKGREIFMERGEDLSGEI